ncbi:hypothetical protein [Vibrio owensii]
MFKRYILTLLLMLGAVTVLANFYRVCPQNPWTRDGRVNAHIVSITPKMTGQVTKVRLSDYSEVEQSDVMFEVDNSLYRVAYHKAIASQAQAKAALDKALLALIVPAIVRCHTSSFP